MGALLGFLVKGNGYLSRDGFLVDGGGWAEIQAVDCGPPFSFPEGFFHLVRESLLRVR